MYAMSTPSPLIPAYHGAVLFIRDWMRWYTTVKQVFITSWDFLRKMGTRKPLCSLDKPLSGLAMDKSQATIKLAGDCRWEIIRRYWIEDCTLDEIQQYLQQGQRQLGFEPQLTYVTSRQWIYSVSDFNRNIRIDQLRRMLEKCGITKNLRGEALVIKDYLGSALTTWHCLVFANDVLLGQPRYWEILRKEERKS